MNTQLASRVLVVLLASATFGCYSAPIATTSRAEPAATTMTRTELFFGLTRPDGGPNITPEQFRAFVDIEIAPRFPNGLTIFGAEGQWRERTGRIVKEPSRVVMILHESTVESDRKLDEIRESYKKKFGQEAVMRVDDVERVSF